LTNNQTGILPDSEPDPKTSWNSVRFIQFADTHIRPESLSLDGCAALTRAIEHANARAEFVVHTGDLVSRPAEAESYRVYRDLLDTLKPPIFHIPGNHDNRNLMKEYVPDGCDLYPWSFSRGGVVFIGLDSSSGIIDHPQLERLSHLLQSDCVCLIFIHHHLCRMGNSWMNPFRLEKRSSFSRVLRRSRARIIGLVHGHIHHHAEFRYTGIPVYSAAALTTQFDPYGEFKDTTDDPPVCYEFSVSPAGVESRLLLDCGPDTSSS
jgi:3',5'-cyclic-AMP phosphodiesterase